VRIERDDVDLVAAAERLDRAPPVSPEVATTMVERSPRWTSA
jgi:hypothetical protein